MKHTIILSLFSLLSCLSVKAQTTTPLQLSNEQCRLMAKKSNRLLQVANNNLLKAETEKELAFSNYLPDLSGTAGMMYPTKDNELQEGMELSLKGAHMAGLTLSVPVYTGGKVTAGYQSAQIGVEANKLNIQKQQADIVYEADQAYWVYVSVCQKVKLVETYQRQLQELLNQVRISVGAEMGTRNDQLLVEARKSQIDYQLQKARNGQTVARYALCQKIGVSSDTPIIPSDTIVQVAVPQGDWLNQDYSTRPELQLLKKQIELKKLNVKIVRADYLPTFALSGGYSYIGGIKIGGNKIHNDGVNFMAVLSVPIYHVGDNWKKVKKARLEQKNSQLEFEHNKELMGIEVQQQQSNMMDAYQMVQTAELAFHQAEEALRITRLNYNEQMKTLTDLLEAQSSWQEAYSNLIESRTNYRVQQTAYLKAVGRLE